MSGITLIHMQPPPSPCIGVHVHPCPECYERKPCIDTCSREPDVENDDGMQAGCYAVCDACRPRTIPVTDDHLDAPDGAVVDGYERIGDHWRRLT